MKEQMAAHRDNKSCNACHKDIDPYGFALEGFDPTGQKRTKYRVDTYHHKSTFNWRPKGFSKRLWQLTRRVISMVKSLWMSRV